MATDFGPATGSPEINIGSQGAANVFIEQHVQGPVTTAISSGIPGGTSGPASAQNNLGPADFATADAGAYGTVSSGAAVVPVFNAGGTSASFGPANPSGAGNLNLFRFKNPG